MIVLHIGTLPWRLAAIAGAILIAACTTQPPYKCTADNVASSIDKTQDELIAVMEKDSKNLASDTDVEVLEKMLTNVLRISASTTLLNARLQAGNGKVQEACDAMLKVRDDESVLDVKFTAL